MTEPAQEPQGLSEEQQTEIKTSPTIKEEDLGKNSPGDSDDDFKDAEGDS